MQVFTPLCSFYTLPCHWLLCKCISFITLFCLFWILLYWTIIATNGLYSNCNHFPYSHISNHYVCRWPVLLHLFKYQMESMCRFYWLWWSFRFNLFADYMAVYWRLYMRDIGALWLRLAVLLISFTPSLSHINVSLSYLFAILLIIIAW